MTVVAILGGHGQISRSLVYTLPQDWDLRLFSRDSERPHSEAAVRGAPVLAFERFVDGQYDLVINAAGPGNPGLLRDVSILRITEALDNLVLDYLATHPETAYIFLSTGALYSTGSIDGPNYDRPVSADPMLSLPLNRLDRISPYVIAKLAAETKHRHSGGLRITDLRIFGYFSRWMSLDSQFFLAQVVVARCQGRTFHTYPTDFVRDLISPDDLADQIVSLVTSGIGNDVYDAISAKPVTKFEILDGLRTHFNLEYVVDGGKESRLPSPDRATALRENQQITYCPRLTSLELVLREMKYFPVHGGWGAVSDGNT